MQKALVDLKVLDAGPNSGLEDIGGGWEVSSVGYTFQKNGTVTLVLKRQLITEDEDFDVPEKPVTFKSLPGANTYPVDGWNPAAYHNDPVDEL